MKLNAVTVTSGTTKTVSAGPRRKEMQKHHMGWVETLPSRMNGFQHVLLGVHDILLLVLETTSAITIKPSATPTLPHLLHILQYNF